MANLILDPYPDPRWPECSFHATGGELASRADFEVRVRGRGGNTIHALYDVDEVQKQVTILDVLG